MPFPAGAFPATRVTEGDRNGACWPVCEEGVAWFGVGCCPGVAVPVGPGVDGCVAVAGRGLFAGVGAAAGEDIPLAGFSSEDGSCYGSFHRSCRIT